MNQLVFALVFAVIAASFIGLRRGTLLPPDERQRARILFWRERADPLLFFLVYPFFPVLVAVWNVLGHFGLMFAGVKLVIGGLLVAAVPYIYVRRKAYREALPADQHQVLTPATFALWAYSLGVVWEIVDTMRSLS